MDTIEILLWVGYFFCCWRLGMAIGEMIRPKDKE